MVLGILGIRGYSNPGDPPEIASESLGELISRSATAERYDQAALAGVPMPEATWEATRNTVIFIVGSTSSGSTTRRVAYPVSLLDATIDRAKAQIGEGRATAGVRLAAAGPRSRPPR